MVQPPKNTLPKRKRGATSSPRGSGAETYVFGRIFNGVQEACLDIPSSPRNKLQEQLQVSQRKTRQVVDFVERNSWSLFRRH